MQSKKSRSTTRAIFETFIAFLLVSAVATQSAHAQKFKVLHTFHGKDGASPFGGVVRDAAGSLYGTTIGGGTGKCTTQGCGSAFEFNKEGKQVWLYSFRGSNGYNPAAGLLRDPAGNLFGTTSHGGDMNCNSPYGCGIVFELNRAGKQETVLHKFTGTPDGSIPEGLLAEDTAGNLYGTTPLGGNLGNGAVFKIDKSGTETVLYNFSGGSDGYGPDGGVVRDSGGNLYGTAMYGGVGFGNSGYGVVFKVDPSGTETVLHAFESGSDGANPASALLLDLKGNVYGMTEAGGNSECGGTGCGTVFEVSPESGGVWTETVLYAFCSVAGCADGVDPLAGPLVMDAVGNLYGTTYFGGTADDGVMFELSPAGKETVLHSFTGGSDGANPRAGVIMDSRGNLYGTTEEGGAKCYTSYTCGVVFKITP
jgi:uncharacterized repeat protein (TIGR03803 family)